MSGEIKTHILVARCIDGTIYYGYGGWTEDRHEAQWMTPEACAVRRDMEIAYNQKLDLDHQIGQFRIIPIPEDVFVRKSVVEYLCEGNTKEDLANQLCEALSKEAYSELVMEMKESQFNEEDA